MTDPDSRKPTTWKDFTHLNWDTTLSKSLSFSYSICFIWATCEFAAMADIFTTQPLILLHKSSMLSQWLQSTSTKADRGMSVSVTIHRDSLICAVCSSVTAAKELFLFNADWWGKSCLRPSSPTPQTPQRAGNSRRRCHDANSLDRQCFDQEAFVL